MRLSVTTLVWVLLATAAQAASIVPHRAVYELSLLKVTDGAGLSGAEGRLAFEVQGSACEGWTTNFRMANRFSPNEGPVRVVDTQSTSFESGDALELHYSQKEFINGSLRDQRRIKVNRPALGTVGKGVTGTAKPKPFDIPAEALFPTQHQLQLMALAEKGEQRDSSVIFDGAEDDKTYRVISFIGKRKAPGSNQRDNANPEAKPLAELASWPVTVSYYPMVGSEDTPDYQVSFDLYENGVATGLVLDYGQFVLGGALTKLESLGGTPCSTPPAP